jgi:hypothetical protein
MFRSCCINNWPHISKIFKCPHRQKSIRFKLCECGDHTVGIPEFMYHTGYALYENSQACNGPKYTDVWLGLIRIITNLFIVLIFILLFKKFCGIYCIVLRAILATKV